jgi:NAD(P)-dependent dehydrogenase (short-subunit alcohol dehydrogenase family)
MAAPGTLVVIGGTSGLGLAIARQFVTDGHRVVISGRDQQRAEAVAKEIAGTAGGENPPEVTGIGLDLTRPAELSERLAGLDRIDHLVLTAIDRDENTARDYDIDRATRLVVLKLVGYTAAVQAALPRLSADGSIVLFGGMAKDRPYPGSTTVTTVNGGVSGLVRTLAVELAPIRVNALHPGIVGDSPQWADKPAAHERVKARTPGGRMVTMADVVDATAFLLRNRAVNGFDLHVDGGWMLM